MKHRVALNHVPDYSPDRLREVVTSQIKTLGGIDSLVKQGQKVLIKPNMLAGKPPEKAVTTHPEVVRAVIEAVQKTGCEVQVGDSPGIGKPETVARKCGIMQVIEETGVAFAPFTESINVPSQTGIFHHLEIARDILDADVIINLPKLKTHQMMGLTCGVKNLFGAVVGMRKPRLHLQAGSDKEFFALMLLDLADYLKPALTLVDGVTAMEGDGPGSGDPIDLGLILSSRSALAVDTVACELLNLPTSSVWTQKVARQRGMPGCQPDEIELVGDPLDDLRPERFRPAKSTDVNFNLPDFIKKPLKKSLSAHPEPDRETCVLCGECVRSCPPQAMSIEKGLLQIDLDRCIHCFCCQELCPHGAIATRQGLLLKLAGYLGKSN
ncbi:MAG: (4Fe-4S)-binding protein [Desulfuromonas sp.]|nr:MAG: (4Fe-4S)-binding protein [Desulfuromonas sp.]